MLSCVCILIYTSQERRTHGWNGLCWAGLGYNKRKNRTNQKRDTCSFFCCRPENIAVGPDLLLLLLLEAFCCCYCGFCNFHAWPKHRHTSTLTACRPGLSTSPSHANPARLFYIFQSFSGASRQRRILYAWAFVRALCGFTNINKANNCGPSLILTLIETGAPVQSPGYLVSWLDLCAAFCCQLVLVFQLSPGIDFHFQLRHFCGANRTPIFICLFCCG